MGKAWKFSLFQQIPSRSDRKNFLDDPLEIGVLHIYS